MKRFLFIMALLLTGTLLFARAGHASYTWYTYNGHTYALTSSDLSWTAAEAEAVAAGGYLVTINDAAEEAWLQTTFGTSAYWIGFSDEAVEGTWVWASGETVTYTDWASGEPNNYKGIEDYAVINWENGGWNDLPVNSSDGARIGIIEVSAVPEPAVLLLLAPGVAGFVVLRRRFEM
jgi:hypothetical protein